MGTRIAYADAGRSWWLVAIVVLLPDLFMVGYLGGTRLGALMYTTRNGIGPTNKLPHSRAPPEQRTPRPRQATVGQPVTRKADSTGSISFAGTTYRVGNAHKRRRVQLEIVGELVEISSGGEVNKTHPIHHDRSRCPSCPEATDISGCPRPRRVGGHVHVSGRYSIG